MVVSGRVAVVRVAAEKVERVKRVETEVMTAALDCGVAQVGVRVAGALEEVLGVEQVAAQAAASQVAAATAVVEVLPRCKMCHRCCQGFPQIH